MKWIVALLLCFSMPALAGVEDDGEPVFLIAKPDMPDPNFAQVFVVSHLPGLEKACDLLIKTTIGNTELIVNA